MNADSFFTIGSPHISACEPCQDYALAGTLSNEVTYAVVSDGCSCYSDDPAAIKGQTDIGSRLVAHAFLHVLKNEGFDVVCSDRMPALLSDRLRQTHYTDNENDLLATLNVVISDGNRFAIICIGDGVIAITKKSGDVEITEVSWNGNVPYYPAYHALGRVDGFLVHHWEMAQPTHCNTPIAEVPVMSIERHFIDRDGVSSVWREQGKAMDCVPVGYVVTGNMDDILSIAVFSDGLTQIPGGTGDMGLIEAASKFIAFKNTKGRFVSRRARAAFSKDIKADPKDDFSVAAIWNGD